jgi:SAP domain
MDKDTSSRIAERQLPQLPLREGNPMASGQDDDFFAFLEADLEKALGSSSTDRGDLGEVEDMLAGLKSESSAPSALNDISARPEKSAVSKQNSKANAEKGAAPATSAADLSQKTVPILKEMLRERGLKVGGNKSELVERLLQS